MPRHIHHTTYKRVFRPVNSEWKDMPSSCCVEYGQGRMTFQTCFCLGSFCAFPAQYGASKQTTNTNWSAISERDIMGKEVVLPVSNMLVLSHSSWKLDTEICKTESPWYKGKFAVSMKTHPKLYIMENCPYFFPVQFFWQLFLSFLTILNKLEMLSGLGNDSIAIRLAYLYLSICKLALGWYTML